MSVHLNLIPTPASQEEQEQIVTLVDNSVVVKVALITVSQDDITLTSIKSKKVTCDFEGCKKRISIIAQLGSKCLCEKTFCPKHRFFKDHDCDFDYQARERERLMKQLVVDPSKKCLGSYRPEGNDAY
jgi:hypothetical protein